MSALTRLLPRVIGTGAVATMLAATVAIAAEPTGAASPAGLVPAGSRLADEARSGAVRVLLVSGSDDALSVVVAFRGRKGWLGVRAGAAPVGVQAAWTKTAGGGEVPALSMAYGSTDTASVRVEWLDGRVDVVHPRADGSWLDVRRGQVPTVQVELLRADGRVESTVTGP